MRLKALLDGLYPNGAAPLIFIGVYQKCLGQLMRGIHLEPTLRRKEELPRARGKSVALVLVRPNHPGHQPT
jgi:hypothetical protein